MDGQFVLVFAVQIVVVGGIAAAIVLYLFRNMMCRTRHDVANKAVLVTGCDSGIGYELARHLDTLGFRVFAGCLRPGGDGAQRLEVETSPGLKIVELDVTNDASVAAAVRFVQDNLPVGEDGLYAVINNAGVCVCGEFEWLTWGQCENQVEVNLLGIIRVTRACLPLIKKKKGRIINVSSIAGKRGYPGLSVYSATKHAMEGLSDTLRYELEKFDVKVVVVEPGDFSKATNLLTNHHRNMNEMWDQMTDSSRMEYQKYFVAYHDQVARTGIMRSRRKPMFELPSSVLMGLEDAVLSKQPYPRYLLLPTAATRLRLAVTSVLPTEWADSIVMRKYRRGLPRDAAIIHNI